MVATDYSVFFFAVLIADMIILMISSMSFFEGFEYVLVNIIRLIKDS